MTQVTQTTSGGNGGKTLLVVGLVVLILVVLGGCWAYQNLSQQTPSQPKQAAQPTATNVPQATPNQLAPTSAPTANVQPTQAPTSSSQTTQTQVTNCGTGSVLRQSSNHILTDLRDGDPFVYWANVFGATVTPEFFVFGDPMVGFDILHADIYFTTYRIHADNFADATCVANALAQPLGSITKIYLGGNKVPDGYVGGVTPALVSGWSMKKLPYQETPISYGGTTKQADISRSSRRTFTTNAGELAYCQLWNPDVKDHATHVLFASGYTLKIPELFQGTCWVATGADQTKYVLRQNQARAEVDLLDNHPVINSLWCGPSPAPDSWEPKPPTVLFFSGWNGGWDCTKI